METIFFSQTNFSRIKRSYKNILRYSNNHVMYSLKKTTCQKLFKIFLRGHLISQRNRRMNR